MKSTCQSIIWHVTCRVRQSRNRKWSRAILQLPRVGRVTHVIVVLQENSGRDDWRESCKFDWIFYIFFKSIGISRFCWENTYCIWISMGRAFWLSALKRYSFTHIYFWSKPLKIDSATIANEKVNENLEFSEKYSISQLLPDSRKSKTRSFQRSQSLRLTKVNIWWRIFFCEEFWCQVLILNICMYNIHETLTCLLIERVYNLTIFFFISAKHWKRQ